MLWDLGTSRILNLQPSWLDVGWDPFLNHVLAIQTVNRGYIQFFDDHFCKIQNIFPNNGVQTLHDYKDP